MDDAQFSIDFAAAAGRRDDGMARAADHVEQDTPGWQQDAVAFIREFATRTPEFLAEDVKAASTMKLAEPIEPRAWGPAMSAAAKAGYIQKDGYQPAKTSNLTPKVLWRSLIFNQEQHENRSA